jgi:hypothetical protein
VLADAGVENVNAQVDALISTGVLPRGATCRRTPSSSDRTSTRRSRSVGTDRPLRRRPPPASGPQ